MLQTSPERGFDEVLRGRFVRRLNRFSLLLEVEGSALKAHLPNSGRLEELLLPGRDLLAGRRGSSLRVLAAYRGEDLIPIDSSLPNELLPLLLPRIPELEGFRISSREVRLGRSRVDFLLESPSGGKLFLEVKGCTLFHGGIALFPDAPTARGLRHLEDLSASGRGAILFLVQGKAKLFSPNFHTDLAFSRALLELRDGLSVMAYSLPWESPLNPRLDELKPLSIPWEEVEGLARDRGSYVLVLENPEDQEIAFSAGEGGRVHPFPMGFYAYVGSAMGGLNSRLRRHARRRKRSFWHIDRLTERMRIKRSIPIRGRRLECDLARALSAISDGPVEGFGSSDCGCSSHLFFFREDPTDKPSFVELILEFKTLRTFGRGATG